MKKLVTSIIIATLCSITYAQSNDSLPSASSLPQTNNTLKLNQPPSGKNPAIHAAIEACAKSSSKDSSGHPERTAMDTCMKAKGFAPPEGHGDGERKGPPLNK